MDHPAQCGQPTHDRRLGLRRALRGGRPALLRPGRRRGPRPRVDLRRPQGRAGRASPVRGAGTDRQPSAGTGGHGPRSASVAEGRGPARRGAARSGRAAVAGGSRKPAGGAASGLCPAAAVAGRRAPRPAVGGPVRAVATGGRTGSGRRGPASRRGHDAGRLRDLTAAARQHAAARGTGRRAPPAQRAPHEDRVGRPAGRRGRGRVVALSVDDAPRRPRPTRATRGTTTAGVGGPPGRGHSARSAPRRDRGGARTDRRGTRPAPQPAAVDRRTAPGGASCTLGAGHGRVRRAGHRQEPCERRDRAGHGRARRLGPARDAFGQRCRRARRSARSSPGPHARPHRGWHDSSGARGPTRRRASTACEPRGRRVRTRRRGRGGRGRGRRAR